jgi:hypothetical protein
MSILLHRLFYFLGRNVGITISSDQANITLRTIADNAGYSGTGPVTITINAGVNVYSTSPTTAAIVTGSFSSGTIVTLINRGYISGAGGTGGTGYRDYAGSSTPTAPTDGGTALDATGVSGFTLKVDNTGGVIRGGGGGGGYGGGSSTLDNETFDCRSGGGGGGGGQGYSGGSGGGGGSIAGTPPGWADGYPGSASAAGAGGTGTTNNNGIKAGDGGAGGAWGTAGSSGSDPENPQGPNTITSTGAGGGGAGGNSVTGNSNITWLATGTRTGSIS